jgi:hypothetical protein
VVRPPWRSDSSSPPRRRRVESPRWTKRVRRAHPGLSNRRSCRRVTPRLGTRLPIPKTARTSDFGIQPNEAQRGEKAARRGLSRAMGLAAPQARTTVSTMGDPPATPERQLQAPRVGRQCPWRRSRTRLKTFRAPPCRPDSHLLRASRPVCSSSSTNSSAMHSERAAFAVAGPGIRKGRSVLGRASRRRAADTNGRMRATDPYGTRRALSRHVRLSPWCHLAAGDRRRRRAAQPRRSPTRACCRSVLGRPLRASVEAPGRVPIR